MNFAHRESAVAAVEERSAEHTTVAPLGAPHAQRFREACTLRSSQTNPRRVAYEVALKSLVAADTFIFPGSSDKALSARTRRHGARAIPLDKDFVPIRVRDYARAIRPRMSFIDVVKESAIDSGFVQKALALIVEHDPGRHTGINHAVLCKLLHLPGEGPAVVTGVFSALG